MQLNDEHIAFILDDIKANGIVIEDLQNNLLDHICCIVENEMPEGEDFYKFYGCIMPRFFKKDLKEIEEETNNLLTFKNYYAMKSTVKISGIISAFLILGGSIFKTMHWPGAGFMIMLGGLLFSLIFVPLMIVLKFKDDETTTDKWVFAFGFVLAMVAALGIIFKVFHWPYANFGMRWSVTLFLFGYIPLYYFTRIRRPETKFNTTINMVLMMACGGMMYALFNLHPSTGVQESVNASYDFMQQHTIQVSRANEALHAKKASYLTSNRFHQSSINLYQKIDSIKAFLIASTDKIPIEKAKQISLSDVQGVNDNVSLRNVFENSTSEFSLQALEREINAYNELVAELFPSNQEKLIAINQLQFRNTILSVVLYQLSQVQWQVVSSENSYLEALSD